MVRRRAGVFIFGGWLRRGDTTVPHAVGFNAGAGLLYVGPYVVVVQESDRINLDVFAARMDAQYGLYLSETCKSRQAWAHACRRHLLRPPAQPPTQPPHPHLLTQPPPLTTSAPPHPPLLRRYCSTLATQRRGSWPTTRRTTSTRCSLAG